MRSLSRRHISNSAKFSHSRIYLPFSRSQVKLPLLLEVAGHSALSRSRSRQSSKGGALGPGSPTCSREAREKRTGGKNGILERKLDWRRWGRLDINHFFSCT